MRRGTRNRSPGKLRTSAASPWRDRRPVRAGSRMSEKSADLVRRLRRQNVFKLAGLLLDFGFTVHGERIGEKALGQAVAADDVGGALVSARSKLDDRRAIADRHARRL